jgi:hypothetical protein
MLAAFAKDLKISHIEYQYTGTDNGDIKDLQSGLITLKMGTKGADTTVSRIIYRSDPMEVSKAHELLGYFRLAVIADTSAVGLDSLTYRLYTGYPLGYDGVAGYWWRIDSAKFVAAGVDYITIDNDTILKELIWYDVELSDSTNYTAADSTHRNSTIYYKVDADFITR